MSWLWGKGSPSKDPTKSLDSDLKQFLDEQHSKPYIPNDPSSSIVKTPQEPTPRPTPQPLQKPNEAPEDRPLPKESLFQDGRYKDIWKTYVPQEQADGDMFTPAQKLIDMKKDRKASLHKAALENCAFEEEVKLMCFSSGSAVDRARARMTMCRREAKAFNRCFQLQAKFLQALGYQNNSRSDPMEDEMVQMHADKLYHRMMDYEASVDEAKQNGQPIPPLTSVFDTAKPAPTVEQINLPAKLEAALSKPLKEMSPHERELAARAVLQEAKTAQSHADDLFKYTTTLNEGRQERQKKLVAMFGDTMGKFFIPDAPNQEELKPADVPSLERDFWKDDFLARYKTAKDNEKKG